MHLGRTNRQEHIRASGSDRDRAEAVWLKTEKALIDYLLRRVPPDDAADLFGNVGLAFTENMTKVLPRSEEAQRQWLFTVARNEVTDYWRRARARRFLDLADLDETLLIVTYDPSAKVDCENIQKQLTREERVILELRGMHEADWPNIGKAIHKSAGAARMTYNRVISYLKRANDERVQGMRPPAKNKT